MDQVRELSIGLEGSGRRFLWVVKGAVLDRDHGGELSDLLGWWIVTKVLGHPVGGLVISHCGWNTVTKVATSGLAWPRFEEERVNVQHVVARAFVEGAVKLEKTGRSGEPYIPSTSILICWLSLSLFFL